MPFHLSGLWGKNSVFLEIGQRKMAYLRRFGTFSIINKLSKSMLFICGQTFIYQIYRYITNARKIFSIKCYSYCKKLYFCTRFRKERGVRREGRRKRKFFESLRPAQDTCAAGAARGKEPFKRNTKRTSRRNPRFRIQTRKTIVQRRV